ncbi:MAG: hypothetical protein SH868_15300 [Bythopirellula sp.]|nr:hypothetical protein [Bythopirellula sp.]
MPHYCWPAAGSLKGCAVLVSSSLPPACRMDWWKLCSWLLFLTASFLLINPQAVGQEKSEADIPTQFLEKLRERGWHDIALEYLEIAEDDPLATREFLADREYHLAVTRAALARQTVGESERQSLLEAATAGFQKFAREQPTSPNYVTALSQVGNMLAEQALATLNKADRLPSDATSEQETLRATAREIIEQAAAAVGQLLESVDERIAKMPRGAALQASKGASALKQDLLAKQAEGRFLAANLNFEKARTYRKGSVEYEGALETAAAGFKQLRKQYENKLVGFYAVLYEARCYQNAGDFDKALDTYGELINQPVGQPDFRKLIARAYRYRAECYLADGKPEKAIEECQDWLDQSSRDELEQAEWVAVSYQLGTAYATEASENAGDSNASRLRADARKLFREVSRQPGEFQDDARAALALSGNDGDAAPVEVTGFADALSAGKSALEQMNSAQLAVKLAANNNPEGVPDLEEQVTSSRQQALNYFEQAVKFIDDKTPNEDAVEARYYLCWLYWEGGRSEEAAELGQQIADKHSDSQYAPIAAKVALAAYERLYLEAKNADAENADLLADKLRGIAELIVERWNDSDAATTATNLLISLALRDNQFDEADRLLDLLPEKSRGSAGLSLGGSLWSQYLQQTSGNNTPLTPETVKLRTRAGSLLAAGYESLAKSSDITPAQAASVLYYVQVLLADGNAVQAVEVLENPRIGPLAVMERGGSDEQDQAFALETSKAALRAYVSVDPPRNDDAIAMMEQLEEITGDSDTARNQLTGIYVNLGLQLQEQIKQLTASGNNAKARGVAAAFASLLERVAERGDAQSWPVQNWLAQTSLQLGSGLSGKDADRYLSQAEDAYRSILKEVEKNPKFAPNELAVLAVRKKLGETLQARGNYALATEQFVAILQEKPNMLELQQAMATALQAWGSAKSDVKVLEQSIRGMKPQANGKNLVWGWLQLATVADYAKRKAQQMGEDSPQNKEAAAKYEDIYFLARFQAAQARLAAAKLAEGESRTKQLSTVRQSIAALKQLYPDLGGPAWQAKFEALLKEVDTLLKETSE